MTQRPEGLGGHWWVYVVMGVLSLLGGMFALLNPYIASVFVLQLVAFLFIFLGVMQVAFTLRSPFGLSWFDLGMGVLQILLGVMLATNVLGGLVSLTLILAFLFMLEGVILVMAGINLRPFRSWIWLVVGGVISILLAVFVLMNLPEAAATLLGLLLGIDLMSNGLWLVAAGLTLRDL
ncbi:MAG: DUF308 domain-containing protein [Rhodobacterales bacterium]|jgi:uncharacterized membrane protein HdeD (DUF308 family)|nr:DUF308 domain-containing protein [Rhodobacterales bacterium]